ncbi:diadenosine tetraphosphate hydrolase [Actinoplanes oblitus]|uniref:Diadenosine tetraphosphate hydrolase n=1 Tax=Actinoplanes oblitus TaxID=3040509 RepID=A0ABY8W4F8_9ACTN|nr:HIT domain-containing protein [Actinoplanes oblitus]WIM92588.1 diadenosine tetraphosphate hydrolase [Actinoplanes oblitus]
MTDWRADRIGSAARGENPTLLARMPGGYAVIGDTQFLPEYCVLLTDDPAATRLSDLPHPARMAFLASMDRLAEAVERACASLDPAFLRVNLEILGNTDPFLHAHIFPRYAWEPEQIRRGPVWRYPAARWAEAPVGPEHDELRAAITGFLV